MSDPEASSGTESDGPESRARPQPAAEARPAHRSGALAPSRADSGGAERARERLALLAESSKRLAASLDYETTLSTIASFSLSRSGDWSIVDLLDADGTIRRLPVVHPDPDLRDIASGLQGRTSSHLGDGSAPARVMETGRVERGAMGDDALASLTQDPEQIDLLRALDVRTFVIAPMISQGAVLGTITFVRSSSAEPMNDEDVILSEDLASRAAMAIESARLHLAASSSSVATKAAVDRAEEAGRRKAEFLATMSHEFRTPLNAILGYSQILDMGVLGPTTAAQHAHLERLQASARHLLQLVDDVLDVAKVDADRLEMREEVLTTGASVAGAVALVQPQAMAKGIRLLDLGADSPGYAFVGDDGRVRQILVNLLSNAVKFTPPGGELTVISGTTDVPDPGTRLGSAAAEAVPGRVAHSKSGWAYIRVTDTGPGISPEFMSQMFEPFVQADAALTREKGGSGLGLAISRRLARRMGGDITVRSRIGAGATFTLWLPTPYAPHSAPSGPEPATTAGRPTPASTRAIRGANAANLDAAAYAVLYAIGTQLTVDSESIAQRYVEAIRSDGRFPGAHELRAAQLRDHATPFVGLLASQLTILGETRGQDPELLADGGHLQRLMAELHGAQRHRLGWSEADIERETRLLFGEVERAIRSAVDAASTTQSLVNAADAAMQYAIDVAYRVLDQARHTTVRSHRFAREADAP